MFRNSLVRAGSVPFSDNGVVTLDIPRGFLARNLLCRLAGNQVVGVANYTTIAAEAPYTLIQRVEVIADGRDTIKSLTGAQLFALTCAYYGGVPPFVAPVVGVGTNAFSAFFVIPFASPLARSPIDTLLDTRRYEQIQLRVTWGVGTGAAGVDTDYGDAAPTTTTATTNCALEVVIDQTAEPSKQLFSIFRQSFQEQVLTASSTDFDFTIPVGNTLRGVLIRTTTGDRLTGAGLVPVNTIITDLSLIADSAHFPVNRVGGLLQRDWGAVDYRVGNPAGTTNALPPGYYLIDFAEDGMLTAAIQTADIASLKLRLNVVQVGGTNRIQVVLNEIVNANVADAVAASIGS